MGTAFKLFKVIFRTQANNVISVLWTVEINIFIRYIIWPGDRDII